MVSAYKNKGTQNCDERTVISISVLMDSIMAEFVHYELKLKQKILPLS